MAGIAGGGAWETHLNELARKLGQGGVLSVGFLENKQYPNGTPVALVAAVQNYGAPSRGIPPRPFMTHVVEAGKETWGEKLARLIESGEDPQLALSKMGELIKGEIQAEIFALTDPPLAEATVQAKGFDKPLVDTREMTNSVDYEVKKL